MAQEVAFAYSVGACEQQDAAQRGALREMVVGLLQLGVAGKLLGVWLVVDKGDAGGSPLVGVATEGGVVGAWGPGVCLLVAMIAGWLTVALVVLAALPLAVVVQVYWACGTDQVVLVIDF